MTVTTEQTLLAAVQAALTLPPTGIATPGGANVGNGTVVNIRAALPAVIGAYALAFTDTTHYSVTDPKGNVIGAGVTNQPFSEEGLSLAVMTGTAPFAANDSFAVNLAYPTAAGAQVYMPRDWPLAPNGLPTILIYWPEEEKDSLGPNAPAFDVLVTIRLVARVLSLPGKGDAGATAALAALGVIKRQIEVAVINNYALYRLISEIQKIHTRAEVKDNGEQHVGELTMDMVLKYAQGTGDFAPILTSPVGEIAIYADLLDVADPSGTYSPPFAYPVTPEPRTEGPDGRVEAGVVLPVTD